MATDDTYNGWSNRETWLVNLWLSNEPGSDELVREWADECIAETDEDESPDNRRAEAAHDLADRIEAMHDEAMADMTGCVGVFADLLTGALARVDWREIADNIMSDVDIPEPTQDEPDHEAVPASESLARDMAAARVLK